MHGYIAALWVVQWCILHRVYPGCQVSGMLTGDEQAAGDCAFCLLPACAIWPSSMPTCMQLVSLQYLLGSLPLRAPGF